MRTETEISIWRRIIIGLNDGVKGYISEHGDCSRYWKNSDIVSLHKVNNETNIIRLKNMAIALYNGVIGYEGETGFLKYWDEDIVNEAEIILENQ